jgi:hypothetical protein
MTKQDEDGFLERWSRRKRGESADGDLGTEAAEAPPLSEADPAESDEGDPEVIAKLPDLDSLTEETDFTVFFQDGVPEALRRKALRKLWRLNPIFAHLDGLNDYDEDFSALGIIAENIKTMYKVGRGFMDDDDDEKTDETEAEDKIAEGEPVEVEAVAESEPHAESESEKPETGDSDLTTVASQEAPESESHLKKPAPGSALARRWGGSLDRG